MRASRTRGWPPSPQGRRPKARAAGEKHACAFYTDYREMLKRDDIDIVTICTPAALHLPMAMDAAAAGKHCIVEKPIEINVERSERISFVRQYEDVMDAVKRGRPPTVTGQEGLKPVKLIMGIYESSRKNEWVPIG